MWGGPDRRYAAAKFFIYTFAGSVFTLAAVIYLGIAAGTYRTADIIHFAQTQMSPDARFWCLMGLMLGFAIKAPLVPLHTWLPLAHTEAPTGGSVVLAAILLKLGAYGILVIAVPIGLVGAAGVTFPTTLKVFAVICCIGVIYGALAAWVQNDIKKIIAYSSVSHMGLCVLASLALNDIGMSGSVLYMINHGILTGAMFLLIGMVYERFHTRDIDVMSGLAKRMPVYATFFVFFVMASIGLPGLNGFVSEFLSMLGAFTSKPLGSVLFGAFAALGMIVGALYMLHLTARIIFGPLKVPATDGHWGHESEHGPVLPQDIRGREIAVLVPLALAVVVLGVAPNLVLHSIQRPLESLRTGALPTRVAESSPSTNAGSLIELSGSSSGENVAQN
jgi:NADH-quinone oxidoreductase subunit M